MEIFILEDDPPFARGLAEQLGKWNHTVAFHARSHEEAIQWLATTEKLPDAAILDLCLGDDDNREGFDVAELLAKKYRVPFVFYSGLDDGSTARLVAQYGAEQFIKGEIRSLRNALIRIQARKQITVPAMPPQESYETARISINDTENRGAEIIIPLSKIVCIRTQDGNRAGRIELYVTDGKKITSHRSGHHTMSSFIKALEEQFPSLNLSTVFIQINRYTRINKNYISRRESDEIYLGEQAFTVGDRYKEDLKKHLPPKI
jgi:CheY-like chemotaxis protein